MKQFGDFASLTLLLPLFCDQTFWFLSPEHLRTIYPVFHISQLEPAPLSNIPNHNNPLPSPIEVNGNLKFEVAQILDSKWDQRKRDPLLYYVRWASYEGIAKEFSWLTTSNLWNTRELVADFHMSNPSKPSPMNLPSSTWRRNVHHREQKPRQQFW